MIREVILVGNIPCVVVSTASVSVEIPVVIDFSGTIAGIASIAGYRGLPKSGAYCASKSALITLLESTRIDLRGTGVDVVTVCPGFVKSEITARNDPKDMMFLLETDDGVRRMIRGIERKERLVHFPWQLSCLA